MIVGDSIVQHVRATLAEGKLRTHCFPGARVLDVSAQIPAILKDDESVGAVVAARRRERHQAAADGDTEEGLQDPDRDSTQHIAHDDDHRVRTASHVPTRKVQ